MSQLVTQQAEFPSNPGTGIFRLRRSQPDVQSANQNDLFSRTTLVRHQQWLWMKQVTSPREPPSVYNHPLCPATGILNLFLFIRGYSKELLIVLIITMVFLMLLYVASCLLMWHVSDAAPISNPLPAAISGSSDAWASLVANVAPLLVLVGEKHVKGYFKSMSNQSHFLLYAVSPIGLITTIVTLIRLHGTPFMKKVIGRQFETRSEVLADVTSVSYNGVGLEYKGRGTNQVLEQTTSPSPEDEARVGVYLSMSGSGRIYNKAIYNHIELIRAYDEAIGCENSREIGWYTIDIVSVRGDDGLSRARNLAFCLARTHGAGVGDAIVQSDFTDYFASYDGGFTVVDLDEVTRNRRLDECTVLTATHLHGPGLSPSISSTAGVGSQIFSYFSTAATRYIASSVCIFANIAIIAIDATTQEETMTLVLISVGIATVFLTSWASTAFIARAAEVYHIPLEGFDMLSAGVFSAKDPVGTGLVASLSSIPISVPAKKAHSVFLVILLVLCSALAYVSLYLGLRVSVWWVPFAMLGNSVFAACLRTVSTNGIQLESCSGQIVSAFANYRVKSELCSLLVAQKEKYSKEAALASLGSNNGSCSDVCTQSSFGKETCAHVSSVYTVLAISGPNVSPLSNGLRSQGNSTIQRVLLCNAYAVVEALNAKNYHPKDSGDLFSGGKASLRSELIAHDGMWEQELDILVQLTEDFYIPSDITSRLIALLQIWVTEAFLKEYVFYKSRTFSLPHNENPSRGVATDLNIFGPFYTFLQEGQSGTTSEIHSLQHIVRETASAWTTGQAAPQSSWTMIWSHKVMLWMAIKLNFSIQHSVNREDFTRMLVQERSALVEDTKMMTVHTGHIEVVETIRGQQAREKRCQEEFIPWYVDCLIAVGLVVQESEGSLEVE
ncbi:hypothetical protein MMC27_000921 [Xylographa pallens]|nr:hypothetical protein [Xylographa pallens]